MAGGRLGGVGGGDWGGSGDAGDWGTRPVKKCFFFLRIILTLNQLE